MSSKPETTDLTGYIKSHSDGTRYDEEIKANEWRDEFEYSHRGDIVKNLSNACWALENHPEIKGKIRFSEFSCRPVIYESLPWMDDYRKGTDWTDADDKQLSVWLSRDGCPNAKGDIPDAVEVVSRHHKFHPVRDYLDSLEWDGTERIEAWLHTYLGTPINAYTLAVGKMWLISAVARIYKPGCKADCMLIFESSQGIKKSSTLDVLGGDWFTDDLGSLGKKDTAQQLQGVWIIEMSELENITRATTGGVKSFLSRRKDRFRPPYGRRPDDFPRQCIFAGTVNTDDYCVDDTGARRLWPVMAITQELDKLKKDRDQLWAEAVKCFRSGERWWLDKYLPEDQEILEIHEDVVRSKAPHDVWEHNVLEIVSDIQKGNVHIPIRIDTILAKLGVELGQMHQISSKRVGGILRRNGFLGRRGTGGVYEYTRIAQENKLFYGR